MAGFVNGMVSLDYFGVTTSSGNNNDVEIVGSLIYVTVTNNNDAITGVSMGMNTGGLIFLVNTGPSNYLTVKNNDSNSLAINRILTADGLDVTIPPYNSIILGYDVINQMWHVLRVPDIALSSYQATPSDPATTTSSTGVMMGLAGAITPSKSGKVLIMLSGTIDNNTLGNGAQIQLRYGTSTAPTNGAALTGTTAGGLVKQINPSLALLTPGVGPVAAQAVVSGLALGTPYWVDISLARISGGTARIRDISLSIIEL